MTRNTAENHRKEAIRRGDIRSVLHVMAPNKAGYMPESVDCKARQSIGILKGEIAKNKPPKVITWLPTLDKLEDSNLDD